MLGFVFLIVELDFKPFLVCCSYPMHHFVLILCFSIDEIWSSSLIAFLGSSVCFSCS